MLELSSNLYSFILRVFVGNQTEPYLEVFFFFEYFFCTAIFLFIILLEFLLLRFLLEEPLIFSLFLTQKLNFSARSSINHSILSLFFL